MTTYHPPTVDPSLEEYPDPCPHCDDTGEVWVDVELPSGHVREDMHVCGCGA